MFVNIFHIIQRVTLTVPNVYDLLSFIEAQTFVPGLI